MPLLLVVALAVATPAMGVQSVLADLTGSPGAVERSGLRLISGTIARLVRGVSLRGAVQQPARPGPAWTERVALAAVEPTAPRAVASGPAHGTLRVALLDLPPPAGA